MEKLYLVNISVDTNIIMASENEFRAISDTKNKYANDILSHMRPLEMFVTANEIKNKKDIINAGASLDDLPYGNDEKTIGEIWKEMERYKKEQAHKEWLEKYHMTFDFYKEIKNGTNCPIR